MLSISNRPVDIDIDWRAVDQLFQAGQYEQVDRLLDLSRKADAEHALLTPISASLRQLCLACRQCRVDIEWHQQAALEAKRREDLLRENAQKILSYLAGEQPAEAGQPLRSATLQEAEAPESTPPLTITLRLRKLLHSLKALYAFGRTEPMQKAAQSAAPAPEPKESSPAPPPSEGDEPAVPSQPPPTTISDRTPFDSPDELAHISQRYALMVYCFGAFRIFQHDQLIEEWNGLKGQSILKYLLAQRGAPVAKDILMDLFWSDVEPEAARRNLHQAVYSLRQTLRRRDPNVQYVQFENNQYMLNPELSIWLDIEEFEAQVQNGRRLEAGGQLAEAVRAYTAAATLYQGDFLAEDLYEDWPSPRRQQLRTDFLAIANHLSAYHHQRAEHMVAMAFCHQVLALDNCFEDAHRRMMQIYLAQGQRNLAIRQYHLCIQALAEELDVAPDEETTALYESITANS